ncbi:MAG: protein kinase domain-containing protein [Aureliella sp.]
MTNDIEPDSSDPSSFEEVLIAYLEAVESGAGPNKQELCKRFPDLADELLQYIDAEQNLLQMAGPTVAEQALTQASIDTSKIAGPTDTVATSLTGSTNDLLKLETPSQFGRYRIQKFLGEGAMGTVYLAFDEKLERNVALKVPRRRLESESELAKRFDREAKSAAGLEHRNICAVHDVGEIDGTRYLAMAYVDGVRLSDVLDTSQRMTTSSVIALVKKLALALQVAHDKSVVHRDLKPANVMIDAEGEPILMDFGLALQGDREHEVRVTQHGAIIGTPAYMSPEQIDESLARVGPASDMFSLGVIFYELLTGQLPFRGGLSTVIHGVLGANPTKPSECVEDLDPALDAICRKMLSKKASDRFGSMKQLATALESINSDNKDAVVELRKTEAERDSHRRKSRTWLAITTSCLALIPLGIWLSIIAFKTEFGTVEIEIPDGIDGIQVQLAQKGEPIRVLDPDAGWEFSVAEGRYEVHHTGDKDRFQIDRNSLTVTRGETVRLRLTRKPQTRLGNLPALEQIKGLQGPVNALSLSPNNKWLVVAGIVDTRNGYIMLCDSSGRPGPLISLSGRVTGEHIAWFDDHRFAIGTSVGGVVVIDCNLGRIVDGVRRYGKEQLEVAAVPDNKLLAIANEAGNISILDMIRGKLLIDQFEIGQRCRAMGFARRPEGTRLLVCGGHGRIFVRNLGTLKLRSFRFAGTQVHDLHVMEDAKRVIVAAADGNVELVDLDDGEVLTKYLGHTSGVESISVSPDEKLLITGCVDGKVRLFELETGKGLHAGVGKRGTTKQIAINWDSGLLFAGGGSYVTAAGEWRIIEDPSILRWTLPGGEPSQHLDTLESTEPSSQQPATNLEPETDASRSLPTIDSEKPANAEANVSTYEQHMLEGKRWLKQLNPRQAFSEFEKAIHLSPDSLIPRGYVALLAQGSHQDALAATQLDIARHLKLDPTTPESSYIARAMLKGHPKSGVPPLWEDGLAKLAHNFPNDWHVQHTVGLWKLGDRVKASKAFDLALTAAQSPWETAATKLAQVKLAVLEGQIENWHTWSKLLPKDQPDLAIAEGRWLSAYEVHLMSEELRDLDDYVARLRLRTQAFNGVSIAYDSTKGVQYENSEYDINAAAFSPTGTRAALAPNNADSLYLWDPEYGLRSIGAGGEIRALAFLADSERLLIGRPAGHIELLRLISGKPEATLPRIGKINGMAADAEGKRVAVSYRNARCAVWDITEPEPTNEQVFLPGNGWQLAFSPSGEYLAVGVQGQKVLVFDRQLEQVSSLESVSQARFTWLSDERICFGYAETNKIASYSPVTKNTAASVEVGSSAAVVFATRLATNVVLTGHLDGSIWAVDLGSGEHRRVARLPMCRFAHLSLSADHRYLLATGKRPKKNDGGACCTVFEMPAEFVTDATVWVANNP